MPLCDEPSKWLLLDIRRRFNPRRDYCLFATMIDSHRTHQEALFQSQTGLLPLCDPYRSSCFSTSRPVSIPDGIIASLRLREVGAMLSSIDGFNPRRDYCLFATSFLTCSQKASEQFQSQTGLLPLCDVAYACFAAAACSFQSQTGLLPLCDLTELRLAASEI